MTVKDLIKQHTELTFGVVDGYIADLSDKDLLLRPVPGMNHIAWQLGHLISADAEMLAGIGQKTAALPADFAARHSKEAATSDDAAKFCKLAEYRERLQQSKAALLAALAAIPDAHMDQPAPEAMRAYAPKVGDVFAMIPSHWMMHAGQFVAVRRKLGKPAMF